MCVCVCVRERKIVCDMYVGGQAEARERYLRHTTRFHTCHAPCAYTHPFIHSYGKQNKLIMAGLVMYCHVPCAFMYTFIQLYLIYNKLNAIYDIKTVM